jgi:hypothetical protein
MRGSQRGKVPYTVEFVLVPPGEMDERLGLALVVRRGDHTAVYCRADHMTAELASSLTETGTAFSRATIRVDEPVAPKINIVFERLDQSEMPDDTSIRLCQLSKTAGPSPTCGPT